MALYCSAVRSRRGERPTVPVGSDRGARARRGVTDLEPGSGRPNAWILRGRSLERRLWREDPRALRCLAKCAGARFPLSVRRRSVLFTDTEQGSWTLHGAWTGGGAEKAAREARSVRVLITKEDVSRLACLSPFIYTHGFERSAAADRCACLSTVIPDALRRATLLR